jgi:D-Ala-teichoic acid biosynthesis protein
MNILSKVYKFRVLLSEWVARPRVRFAALTIYYLAILAGLIVLYGKEGFTTPPFIYQNF